MLPRNFKTIFLMFAGSDENFSSVFLGQEKFKSPLLEIVKLHMQTQECPHTQTHICLLIVEKATTKQNGTKLRKERLAWCFPPVFPLFLKLFLHFFFPVKGKGKHEFMFIMP